MKPKSASRPAGPPRQYFQSPEAKSCAVRSRAQPWVFVLLLAVSFLFPSLLTQCLFSACAIQPDLHVIWSCSQQKSHNFSRRAWDTGKLKKQGNFWLPRKRKECAPEFKTLADYVIPRNKQCFYLLYFFFDFLSFASANTQWVNFHNIRLKLKPSTVQLAKAFTVYNINLDL